MKFDIETASAEDIDRLLDAKIVDAVTGDEISYVAAFDTETGWRRQYVDDSDRPDRLIEINGKLLNLGKPLKLIEIVGNQLRLVIPDQSP